MLTLITGIVLQVAVVGGLMVWGFRKERRLRREFPERYTTGGESRGY
jgi:hypothetical protein